MKLESSFMKNLKYILLVFYLFFVNIIAFSQLNRNDIYKKIKIYKINIIEYEVLDSCIYNFLDNIAKSFQDQFDNKKYFISISILKSKNNVNYLYLIPFKFDTSYNKYPNYEGVIEINKVKFLLSGINNLKFILNIKKPKQKLKINLSQIYESVEEYFCKLPNLEGFYFDCINNPYYFEILDINIKGYKIERKKNDK